MFHLLGIQDVTVDLLAADLLAAETIRADEEANARRRAEEELQLIKDELALLKCTGSGR